MTAFGVQHGFCLACLEANGGDMKVVVVLEAGGGCGSVVMGCRLQLPGFPGAS